MIYYSMVEAFRAMDGAETPAGNRKKNHAHNKELSEVVRAQKSESEAFATIRGARIIWLRRAI